MKDRFSKNNLISLWRYEGILTNDLFSDGEIKVVRERDRERQRERDTHTHTHTDSGGGGSEGGSEGGGGTRFPTNAFSHGNDTENWTIVTKTYGLSK